VGTDSGCLWVNRKVTSDVNDQPRGRLSLARHFSKALALRKVTQCEINAPIGYQPLRIAQLRLQKAQRDAAADVATGAR